LTAPWGQYRERRDQEGWTCVRTGALHQHQERQSRWLSLAAPGNGAVSKPNHPAPDATIDTTVAAERPREASHAG